MSKNQKDPDLASHLEPQPGAAFELRTDHEGDVTISFSDGSTPLSMNRREFMRVSGVAAATAAMSSAACRHPEREVVPYVDRPEEVRIGQTNLYASVCTACPAQCGMLVKTRAGRPFKLEGNPKHPVSQGALCARGQASYVDLYDPDRERNPVQISGELYRPVTWENLDDAVLSRLQGIRQRGRLRILTGANHSPARASLIAQITGAFPNARHHIWEPLNNQAQVTANTQSYGSAHLPTYRFERADLVVSFGSDFLGTWLSPVEFTKGFASRRDPDNEMNRLITFEPSLSLTGINADIRYRVTPNNLVYVALGVANEIVNQHNPRGFATGAIRTALAPFDAESVANMTGGDVTAAAIRRTAALLAENVGRSIVIAGGTASATETGIALETAVNLLNAALGNDGQTIDRTRASFQGTGDYNQLSSLVAEMNEGNVDMLIIDGTNPVYDAPPELGMAEAMARVPFIVSTSTRLDETARLAHFLATGTHQLEGWGDSMPRTGVYTIQQPTILPLYENRAFEDSLITWFGRDFVPGLTQFLTPPAPPAGNRPGAGKPYDPGPYYRFVRAFWQGEIFPRANASADFEDFWQTVLREGVFTTEERSPTPAFRVATALRSIPSSLPDAQPLVPGDLGTKRLHVFASIPMYDGRQANNGHLQELGDPVSRHTWGAYVMVSFKTFDEAGLRQGEFVTISPEGSDVQISLPVLMIPGMHDDVVAIPAGYGRTGAGVVGNDVGENAFRLSRGTETGNHLSGITVSLQKTGRVEPVSLIKGAGVVDEDYHRILATATLTEYQEDPKAGVYETPHTRNLWLDHDFGRLKWGMAIDMTKCTGCSACTIACQEENNIPVVGRQGILEGREMSWLRMDRYYKLPEDAVQAREGLFSDPMYAEDPQLAFGEYLDRPRVVIQPMLCQHCDRAPCETVCPVLATMQSNDGLNQMVYNRCVGTRYCSNNCPYKVRRYNWFNYSSDRSDSVFARFYPELKDHGRLNQVEPLPLSKNPDVTVRDRGVMEKCTFCVQRIRRGKWALLKEGRREFRDGEVVTACQQACPADAIVFGNMLDDAHQVTQWQNKARAMLVLSDLNTQPAVRYLTSIWNEDEEGTA